MVGYILLGILAVLILLLVLPVTAKIQYNQQQLTIKLRVLFLVFKLFPQKEKPVKEKKPRKKAKEKPDEPAKPQKEKPRKTLSQQIRFIKKLAGSAQGALRFILRHLYISKVRLVWPVHAPEAADTAVQAGRMQALVGSARAVLQNVMHVSYKQLEIVPDFTGLMELEPYFSCNVSASPVIMVIAASIFATRLFDIGRPKRRRRKRKRPVQARQAK